MLSFILIVFILLYHSLGEKILYPTATPCVTDDSGVALVDSRKWGFNTQCRIPCSTFSHPNIEVSYLESRCYVSSIPELRRFRGIGPVCIPRGVCIKLCGKEQPSCVYTGSCYSQTCFKPVKKEDEVNLTRITFSGPGSVVQAGNSSTAEREVYLVSARYDLRTTGLRLNDGSTHGVIRTTTECDGNTPFIDSRNSAGSRVGQCRTLCSRFGSKEFEVIIVRNTCPYYLSVDFLQYFDVKSGVCIPHDICEEECGKAGKGCVYTGICRNKFCFSGLDSKEPAVVDFNGDLSGLNISISVNNSSQARSIDPPVYAALRISIDSGDHRPGPKASASPTPAQAAKPSTSGRPTSDPNIEETSQKEPQNSETDSSNVWVWVGPVLGTVAAAIIGVLGMVLSALIRNKGPREDSSSSVDEYNVLS